MCKIAMILKKLTFSILILLVSLAINFFMTPHAKAYMIVYDANGQRLGLGSIGQSTIYIPELDVYCKISIIINDDDDGNYVGDVPIFSGYHGVFYKSMDCSGNKYLLYTSDQNHYGFFGKVVVQFKEHQGYWIKDYAIREKILPQSVKRLDWITGEFGCGPVVGYQGIGRRGGRRTGVHRDKKPSPTGNCWRDCQGRCIQSTGKGLLFPGTAFTVPMP